MNDMTVSTTEYQAGQLKELIAERALKFGEFKLASGKTAKYYLDCRNLTLTGAGANQIALGMIGIMQRIGWPDLVGGMAIGADPITAAIITCAYQKGLDVRGFMVRKEPKSHGTGRMVEGPWQTGESAIMVEDVVTTGGSSILAIERAREVGLQVSHCIAIVDRLQGGDQAMRDVGVELHSLFTIRDFGLE